MAKFSRTAYAEKGTLGAIAQRIANESGLSTGVLYGLRQRKSGGWQRVRITIEVKPEKVSQRQRPEQSLELMPPVPGGDLAREPAWGMRYPLYGADGGAT